MAELRDRFKEQKRWEELKEKTDTAIKAAHKIDWEKFHKAMKLLQEAIEG